MEGKDEICFDGKEEVTYEEGDGGEFELIEGWGGGGDGGEESEERMSHLVKSVLQSQSLLWPPP